MRLVPAEQFITTLQSSGSTEYRKVVARYDLRMMLSHYECHVHDGDLVLTGDWQPEQANLIVFGSVVCAGLVNFAPASKAVDEGGSIWIFGDLKCEHFANYYRKDVFVDGKMSVAGLAINSFADACLVVLGSFDVGYFYGNDIWVEAGGAISMAYGQGYGLPIGYKDAARHAVLPKHDPRASIERLNSPEMIREKTLLRRLAGG